MGYTPRGDRAGRVALLLGTARDYLDDSRGLLAEPEGESPGAARATRDVERGIVDVFRTLLASPTVGRTGVAT